MDDSSPPPEQRIPYSAGYLAAVLALAGINAWFFWQMIRRLGSLNAPPPALLALSVVFGLLFAGACNLTAISLTRWLERRQAADRILLFLLTEVFGMTLLVLVFPYVSGAFGGPG